VAAGARRRGLFLGTSAGIVFGMIAGAIKATTDLAGREPVFKAWPVYVLVALGACGFLLNQRAYHQASLASSLPALNLLNPVVAVVFGVVAFHERPTGGPLALSAQALSLLAVLLGIYLLSRRPDPDAVPHA
jgi:drug/metabolite transporter (DMT)-like permease